MPNQIPALLAIAVFMAAGTASANAGVPMLAVVWPLLGITIVPIVIVESMLVRRALDLSSRRALIAISAANAFSALIGIPLTWFGLVALQLLTRGGSAHGIDSTAQRILAVTWQSPWLIPYEEHLSWMVPAACLTLTVPFFLASVVSERYVCERLLREHDRSAIRAAVLRANIASYAALAFGAAAWLAVEVRAAA